MILHSTRFCIESSKIGKIHLSPNSVESVQVSQRIQLNLSHQVFVGVKLEPIWTQNPSHPFWTFLQILPDLISSALLWRCWSTPSRFSFSPISLFSLCGAFHHRNPSTYANSASVAVSTILNYWMNKLLNFWTLECWMKHIAWKCANENIRFHPTSEIPSKILSNKNIKCWIKCWMHLRRSLVDTLKFSVSICIGRKKRIRIILCFFSMTKNMLENCKNYLHLNDE